MEAFISCSIYFAVFSEKILSDLDDWEASFLAGLMRDVGILVFDNIIPEKYYKFITLKDLSYTDQPLEELKKDHFKVDHSEAGAIFMGEMVGYFRQGK